MKRQYGYVAAILTSLLVCGCGQKGPLFLPGDSSQTELPKMDRDALEEALEDDEEEGTHDVPDTERPQIEDDDAEPFIDPASPPAGAADH